MSWSISKLYRNAAEAVEKIPGEGLPGPIVQYVKTACDELHAQHVKAVNADQASPAVLPERQEAMVLVHGYGHLCHEGPGGGNYEVTTAKLVVAPVRFGVTLTLPLQVA